MEKDHIYRESTYSKKIFTEREDEHKDEKYME